ncbi:hypothetical protein SAMD00019534_120410 [Acytostelium subglobosum LB1]|uniref:hypothetical protein n=1 Tax=Acytostelium subglobosum LB1 TaxID=1410327 RepID=UPI000644CBA9|nr:hypothetical protein SAMD00019534_120410 [Acytostelium subglobosum LB1]GAM28865.1 hypothetical protein SAMD00019534_120410 [Acytostelium subglobosum LB1]|eukprot:XP_012748237.1 hypothetical protein SAMD00019534_120410 [Acytostelium subglobosum LB1]
MMHNSFKLLSYFGYTEYLSRRINAEPQNIDLINFHRDFIPDITKYPANSKCHFTNIDHRLVGLADIACKHGHISIIELLNQHPDNERGLFSTNNMLVKNGHYHIAKFLFHQRVNKEGFTLAAFQEAAKCQDYELLELLVSSWAPNTRNPVIDVAAAHGRLKMSFYSTIRDIAVQARQCTLQPPMATMTSLSFWTKIDWKAVRGIQCKKHFQMDT